MKLCFLAGANSIHSQRWVKYFADQGHKVYWLSLGIDANSVMPNTEFSCIKKFPVRHLRPLFYLTGLKKILKKIRPDILHVHQIWIDGIIGALAGFQPLILTPWGSDVLIAPRSRMKKPLIKFALKKAACLTCDGANTQKAMMDLGVPAQKIKIICFGTDVKKFQPQAKDPSLIKKLSIQKSPVVISLRSLEPIYDLATLIKAVPLVLKQIPQAKFIIVGDGSQKPALIQLAKSGNILKAIRFIGKISSDLMPAYLNLADVYVSTALSDSGLAASTAEAMVCGLPVVVTNTGDNLRWIQNEKNGFVVPVKNPQKLAKNIIYLLNNKNLREAIGVNNVKVIKKRNNYYQEMHKIEILYQKLTKNYES